MSKMRRDGNREVILLFEGVEERRCEGGGIEGSR